MMATYFRFGEQQASREFLNDEAAIALAERMVHEIALWDFEPGTILQVRNEEGIVIFERRVQRLLN